jgi:hypothetical protein
VEPPLLPAQVQFQGPLPLTVDDAPAVQRLAVGALVRVAPFEEPHAPFTGGADATIVAEQVATVPPLLPAQVQFQGPLPLTADAVPALHRFAVGAVLTVPLFALPQAPVVSSKAEQLAVVPPLSPTQVQFQGPPPLNFEAVPALQRLADGAVVTPTPAAAPHNPFTRWEGGFFCAWAGPETMNERRKANTARRTKPIETSPQKSEFGLDYRQ